MNANTEPVKRQYVSFSFYKLLPAWRQLDKETRHKEKEISHLIYEENATRMILRSYTLLGVRADCDFMFWRISDSLEQFNRISSHFLKEGFGKYAVPVYSYVAQTKRSTYIDKISPEHGESRTVIQPGKFKYLFVYPFVKTRDWYQLPKDVRQAMMDEHIKTGNRYPRVKLNTAYSFGLDDQEFVVAFESDYPGDFLDLVMELRESKASKFTLRDTPTFTCIAKPFAEILDDF